MHITPDAAQAFNVEQRARWNGIDGEFWVREQARLDRTLAPVTGPLLEFAAPRAGSTVLDVGCGCGATTFVRGWKAPRDHSCHRKEDG